MINDPFKLGQMERNLTFKRKRSRINDFGFTSLLVSGNPALLPNLVAGFLSSGITVTQPGAPTDGIARMVQISNTGETNDYNQSINSYSGFSMKYMFALGTRNSNNVLSNNDVNSYGLFFHNSGFGEGLTKWSGFIVFNAGVGGLLYSGYPGFGGSNVYRGINITSANGFHHFMHTNPEGLLEVYQGASLSGWNVGYFDLDSNVSGATMRIIINGNIYSSNSVTFNSTNISWYNTGGGTPDSQMIANLDDASYPNTFYFTGSIGDIYFYNAPLTNAQINSIGTFLSNKFTANWTNI